MVGGLVEQQHVRLFEQSPAERDPAFLSTRELAHVGVGGWKPQRIHRDLDLPVQVPRVAGVDLLLHLRLLLQQLRHLVVRHRLGELVGDLLEFREQISGGFHGYFDVVLDVLGGIELRLL